MKTNYRPRSGVRSIKTAGSSIVNQIKKETIPNLMLVRDIQGTPGNGLWCVNTEKKKKNDTLPNNLESKNITDFKKNSNIINVANPNLELELEFEKRKINQLKHQIEELTVKLNTALSRCQEAEYKAIRAESNKQTYQQLCETKSTEVSELTEKIENLENSVVNSNEALNNSKREIARLQMEIQTDIEKTKKVSEKYQQSLIEKERSHSQLSSEINNLVSKLQHVNNEKENFIKINRNFNNHEKNNEMTSIQKLLEEKENILKLTESHMRNFGNENAELKRKLNAEESMKTKLNEIIKKKQAKIEKLKEDLKSYKSAMETYTNEVKWNQDLVLQKDNQIKIFKEKIKILEEQAEKIKKENKKIKELKNSKKEENENIMEMNKINAKPFLFGPERDNFVI